MYRKIAVVGIQISFVSYGVITQVKIQSGTNNNIGSDDFSSLAVLFSPHSKDEALQVSS
jgi:hypothetical protein